MTLATLLERLVADATLTGATLSRPRTSDPSEPTRLTVDPVAVAAAGVARAGFTYSIDRADGSSWYSGFTRRIT